MFPTQAAFIGMTLLAVLGLVSSRVVEGNVDLLKRTPTALVNLIIFGRFFGWLMLIASAAYVYCWLSSSDRSDRATLGYFAFCYGFALLVMLPGLRVPIRDHCPNCGKWGERHEVDRHLTQQARSKQNDSLGTYVVKVYECRHCGHRWEITDTEEVRGRWEG
jgi:hypothetical protein